MNIEKISSIEDLKALGKFYELRRQLKNIVFPLKFKAKSYDDLLKIIIFLQKKWIDAIPGPFVNRKAEIVFYLTKLDGKRRNELLGLTEEHFRNADLAKKWRKSLMQIVHSDREGGSDEAFIALEKLYRLVTFSGDEDE